MLTVLICVREARGGTLGRDIGLITRPEESCWLWRVIWKPHWWSGPACVELLRQKKEIKPTVLTLITNYVTFLCLFRFAKHLGICWTLSCSFTITIFQVCLICFTFLHGIGRLEICYIGRFVYSQKITNKYSSRLGCTGIMYESFGRDFCLHIRPFWVTEDAPEPCLLYTGLNCVGIFSAPLWEPEILQLKENL